ncbi:MAG: alpha/beta fold hydrolase [Candidatus Omnitrophica bacterium]|nr:alpha/beta fold hydrolase [Candidatus Omnitrophota bacterium]
MIYLIVLLFLIVAAFFICPVETRSLHAKPRPCASYEESMRRIKKDLDSQPENIEPYGYPIIKTHGHKTGRVAVLYHGFTNCPRQYEELAEKFFKKGYNVYVPRVPHHGIGDRLTRETGRLTIEELLAVCDNSVDLARGLGEKITVLGLSMGGVMAAWDAQFRDDVEITAVLVPSFGWYYLPGLVKPLINFCSAFPNRFFWWDPVKKDKRECPYSMYHHFSSRGMGHICRLGLAVLRAAKKGPPLSRRIVVMTNDLDNAVDERNVSNLVRNWLRFGADVDWYHFSKGLKMEHDIIDPLHPYARVDFVYDKIFELLNA